VQIGATAGGNAYNNVAVINGNTVITLNTRNNYTGDTWANRASTLNIDNNFALGSGKSGLQPRPATLASTSARERRRR